MQQLFFFPTHWPIAGHFRAYVEKAGFMLLPYSPADEQKADGLLLGSPIPCGGDAWVSPEAVWQQYFKENNPKIKILQAGWREGVENPNYLCWGNLPTDFSTFFQNANLVAHWEPVPTYGDDLHVIWTRFKAGHNDGGFMHHFIATRRRVQIALLDLEENNFGDVVSFLDTPLSIEKFNNLQVRWRRYAPLLSVSPCHEAIKAIENNVETLGRGWKDCQDHYTLTERMNEFSALFDEIEAQILLMEPYFKHTAL